MNPPLHIIRKHIHLLLEWRREKLSWGHIVIFQGHRIKDVYQNKWKSLKSKTQNASPQNQ
jgi:hypothetical protein